MQYASSFPKVVQKEVKCTGKVFDEHGSGLGNMMQNGLFLGKISSQNQIGKKENGSLEPKLFLSPDVRGADDATNGFGAPSQGCLISSQEQLGPL